MLLHIQTHSTPLYLISTHLLPIIVVLQLITAMEGESLPAKTQSRGISVCNSNNIYYIACI